MAIADQSRERLLTLDEARERLSVSEPFEVVHIDEDSSVEWTFSPTWALTLDTTHGTDPVEVEVCVGGRPFGLTKDAVFTAASAFGLPSSHAKQLPAHLIQQEMNYWFGEGIGRREFNLLVTGGDQAEAFVKPTKKPFSNLFLLDAVIKQVRSRIGEADIYVDFKFAHSLTKTDIRLVIPTLRAAIADEHWVGGIQISNSLIARSQTSIEPYLLRVAERLGATGSIEFGVWNRRVQGQQLEDVEAWAQRSVNDIFDSAPSRFREVEKLTSVRLEGNAQEILREVFKTYGVPYTQQNEILSDLIEADELSMYYLMLALSRLANNPSLKPDRVDTLLRIAGSIPSALFDPLNRKLWDEGHSADPDAVNPYALEIT